MKIDSRINRRPHAVEVLLKVNKTIQKPSNNRKSSTMREAILKRITPGSLILKQIEENCFKLVIFKETKNFFLRMQHFVPEIYSQWEEGKEMTIVLHEGFNFAEMEKSMLKPVKIANKYQLMTGAQNWLNHCNLVANSAHTNEMIDELKSTVFQVANFAYDDKDIKAYLYGSRFTGLARDDADVDIFLEINRSFRGTLCNNIEYQRDAVERLAKEMRLRPNEFEKVFALISTAVPVLRFKHRKSNMNGEVAFRSGISVKNSQLVKLYLDLDDRVKFVVCGVKFWFAENNLNERINFPPVAQTWLALFFLMQRDIAVIPTVEAMRNMMPVDQRFVQIENHWNCAIPNLNVVRSSWKTPCSLSSEKLLEKFFAFYGNIPVERFVLCTFDGSIRLRKQFFKDYIQLKFDKELHARVHGDFSGFCIQDPIDRFKNLTKNQTRTNTRKCVKFVEWAFETAELLKSAKTT